MRPAASPRVKICCIASHAEAEFAVRAGADAVGLVSAMPSGPGPIAEDLIARIAARVPPPVATFLLTSLCDVEAIVAQHGRCGTSTIQLCDAIETGAYAVLRRRLPAVRLVQVIHVQDAGSVEEAARAAPHVDALLLDSGNPQRAVKELGGTGAGARLVAVTRDPGSGGRAGIPGWRAARSERARGDGHGRTLRA